MRIVPFSPSPVYLPSGVATNLETKTDLNEFLHAFLVSFSFLSHLVLSTNEIPHYSIKILLASMPLLIVHPFSAIFIHLLDCFAGFISKMILASKTAMVRTKSHKTRIASGLSPALPFVVWFYCLQYLKGSWLVG
jgi:hypothetical protein